MPASSFASGVRVLLAALVTVAVGTLSLVGFAAPASAGVNVTLDASNGQVGVSQTLSAKVTSDAIGAPGGSVTFTANGQSIGSVQVGGDLGARAQVSWTPSSAGSINVQAVFDGGDGSQDTDSQTVNIKAVDTATSITTPGSSATGSVVTIAAAVRARSGGYVPSGNVQFILRDGTVIGQSGLDGSGRASINYTTPASAGTLYVYATYGGDANANSSKSSTDSIKVTAQGSSVSLVVPQSNYVNTPVQLTAKITPTSATGTVQFYVNSKYLGQDKVNNGTANLTWVPNALGKFTLTAKYSGGGGVDAGSASNSVQVVQSLKPDQITVDPAGGTGPWAPNGSVAMANGASVDLNARASSGQPVSLSVVGPCAMSGNTLIVKGVGGACTLTAASNGGNGFSPGSQVYYVQTAGGAQTAKITAPASGSYPRGSTLNLSKLKTRTNLGQPITWSVTKGGSKCSVVASGKYYKAKLKKPGTCKIKGSAPGVPGQWGAYKVMRTYTIR